MSKNLFFDTHCHLNFQVFDKKLEFVIDRAKENRIKYLLIPGTDLKTSRKAKTICQRFSNTYFSAGIHPHHIYEFVQKNMQLDFNKVMGSFDDLFVDPLCRAVGEIGLDKHIYKKTKYDSYNISDKFWALQKDFFLYQLSLARRLGKAVIIHNRKAARDLLEVLNNNWDEFFSGRMVFHCCEPEKDLLEFALDKNIFIGVDGDLTYNPAKQVFLKKIPLNLLLFETDAPFLTPEPARSKKRFPNEPVNLLFTVQMAAFLLDVEEEKLAEITTENALRLFGLL